jgi:hypothetical protein
MSVLRQSVSAALVGSTLVLAVSCRDATVPEAPSLEALDSPELAGRKKPTPDTQSPAAPVVTLTDLGPTHVSLAWSSTDNSPWPLVYSVAKDGVARLTSGITSGTFQLLQPGATYVFTVRAQDNALNWSPVTTLSVTTPPVDQTDVTPPSTPNVWADLYFDGSRELQVTWTQSTDNVTAQVAIVYHVFVNGVLENSAVGKPQASVYGVAGDNIITVIAVDVAGNKSTPGELRLHIPF